MLNWQETKQISPLLALCHTFLQQISSVNKSGFAPNFSLRFDCSTVIRKWKLKSMLLFVFLTNKYENYKTLEFFKEKISFLPRKKCLRAVGHNSVFNQRVKNCISAHAIFQCVITEYQHYKKGEITSVPQTCILGKRSTIFCHTGSSISIKLTHDFINSKTK